MTNGLPSERELRYDTDSAEVGTGVRKAKYKLIGKHLVEFNQFIAFTATSNPNTCESYLTVCCEIGDWDWIDPRHSAKWQKSGAKSYFDVKRVESLSLSEIQQKIQSRGFWKSALLKRPKLDEIRKVCLRFNEASNPIDSNRKMMLANVASTSQEKLEEIINKYKLG